MPVSDKHNLYSSMLDRIETTRDCVSGSSAVKSRRSVALTTTNRNAKLGIHNIPGSKYLPPPNPKDTSDDNLDRYEAYKQRALFVNFTSHTKDGYLGMINRKPVEVELSTGIEYLNENADGSGKTINQMINKTISELLDAGSVGILADFPASDAGQTASQTSELTATAKLYPRESIVNWRTETISGVTRYNMIVLMEEHEVISDDGFSVEVEEWHRVLLLDEFGTYIQNLYDGDDKLIFDVDEEGDISPDIMPRKFDGSAWDHIPFQFIGAESNDATPQKPMLYDLAEINIAHYRNSADYEESSFMTGQPWPVISGLTQSWVDDVLKGEIMIGSRAALMLPPEADAKLVQAASNQMPSEAMKMKVDQMIKTGAKIITDVSGVETATASKIKFAGQNSKLGVAVNNVEEGWLNVMGWQMEFMGDSGDNAIEINRQFYEASVDPSLIIANIQLLDRGIVAKSDLRVGLRKANLIEAGRTDEEIDEEVETSNPLI